MQKNLSQQEVFSLITILCTNITKKNNQTDSANYYKNEIFKNITDQDAFIYQDLLTEIAPNHPITQYKHEHIR